MTKDVIGAISGSDRVAVSPSLHSIITCAGENQHRLLHWRQGADAVTADDVGATSCVSDEQLPTAS